MCGANRVRTVYGGRKRRLLRRFRGDRSGASAIEFGIVAVPFFLLLFAIIEVSLVFFASFTIENAVDQTARLIRTGQAQTAGLTADQFRDAVCEKVVWLSDCNTALKVEVQRYDNFSGVPATPSNPLNGDQLQQSYPFDPGNGGDVVIVRAFYIWDLSAKMPTGVGLGNMSNGNRLIIASTAFRNEPFD
ncbi:MAG: pilus assembly protein [Methyloligellaceae bacterium]|nr:MAG: pilus assembly protein [Alphaproteobacteria bacterium]